MTSSYTGDVIVQKREIRQDMSQIICLDGRLRPLALIRYILTLRTFISWACFSIIEFYHMLRDDLDTSLEKIGHVTHPFSWLS